MTTRKYLRTMFAAMALSVMLMPQAASAHDSENRRNQRIFGEFGFCVNGAVTQNHGWHWVETFSTNCNNARDSWHAQYQEYFKAPQYGVPGDFCFSEGWHQSPDGNEPTFFNFYGWDIWNWCNNGAWVNVVLYVDSWQYSWKSDWDGWRGGAFRPATSHCHCP